MFYRLWTQKTAQSLGLTGWARNLEDGRVEAVFEGEKAAVEEMIDKCREGSRSAGVEHIDVNLEKATGEFSSFEVRR